MLSITDLMKRITEAFLEITKDVFSNDLYKLEKEYVEKNSLCVT